MMADTKITMNSMKNQRKLRLSRPGEKFSVQRADSLYRSGGVGKEMPETGHYIR